MSREWFLSAVLYNCVRCSFHVFWWSFFQLFFMWAPSSISSPCGCFAYFLPPPSMHSLLPCWTSSNTSVFTHTQVLLLTHTICHAMQFRLFVVLYIEHDQPKKKMNAKKTHRIDTKIYMVDKTLGSKCNESDIIQIGLYFSCKLRSRSLYTSLN